MRRWQTETCVAEQLVYPARPTTAWGPGEEVTLNDVVTLPANTAAGEYRLLVAMVEPENPSLRVQLGIDGRDPEGDPRTKASKELGEKLLAEIVSRLVDKVEAALRETGVDADP